ncbi:MAG: hypothetical protein OXN83_03195, partial [Oligoflexia bacterium]|nr:hypothetical protein [Oligoflexia bacterium]
IDTKEDDLMPLDKNDYVIFSLPFAGNGHYPPNWEYVLEECLKKKVPVMIDCAWFGTCFDMNLDFNHPAITEVSFSLSKGLGVGKVRSGVRYSNFEHDEFPIRHQNNSIYLPIMALQVGMYMMEKIPVDKIPNRYRDLHKKFCHVIAIQNSSKCIHIATPSRDDHRWEGFQVGSKYYKLGVKEAMKAVYAGKIDLIQ